MDADYGGVAMARYVSITVGLLVGVRGGVVMICPFAFWISFFRQFPSPSFGPTSCRFLAEHARQGKFVSHRCFISPSGYFHSMCKGMCQDAMERTRTWTGFAFQRQRMV
jgi:hypothetical protein